MTFDPDKLRTELDAMILSRREMLAPDHMAGSPLVRILISEIDLLTQLSVAIGLASGAVVSAVCEPTKAEPATHVYTTTCTRKSCRSCPCLTCSQKFEAPVHQASPLLAYARTTYCRGGITIIDDGGGDLSIVAPIGEITIKREDRSDLYEAIIACERVRERLTKGT